MGLGGGVKRKTCTFAREKSKDLDEIKEKHNNKSKKGIDRYLNSDRSLNIYLCLPMLGGEMAV